MKVLIVEDSVILQERLKKALLSISEQVTVSQATDCWEAEKLFFLFGPDMIILDISLPDGNGINLLHHFKKTNPDVKVIMLTNYPSKEFKDLCIEFGANQFFDKSDLSHLISNLKENSLAAN